MGLPVLTILGLEGRGKKDVGWGLPYPELWESMIWIRRGKKEGTQALQGSHQFPPTEPVG